MYSAETTIVDVKQTGESEYTLSMTAKDLYVAAQSGDVLRRHDVSESDKAPEKKYVTLSGVKFAEATGKYTFTFASGDVFESTSDTAYPTAESVSDAKPAELPAVTAADDGKVLTVNNSGVWVAQTPASGGGVLVVTDTDGTLDKTWQEIHDAIVGGTLCFVMTDADDTITTQLVTAVFVENETYYADVGIENTGLFIEYMASSASDYPTAV